MKPGNFVHNFCRGGLQVFQGIWLKFSRNILFSTFKFCFENTHKMIDKDYISQKQCVYYQFFLFLIFMNLIMIQVLYPLLHFTSFIIFWYLFIHDMGPIPFIGLQLHVQNGQSFTFYINLHSYFIWDCSSRPGKAIWKESQTKSNSLDGVIHIWGRMSLKQKNNSTISKLPSLLSVSKKKHFDQ